MRKAKAERPYAEERIWRPLAEDPGCLGYRGALTLHQAQLGNQSGYVDLIILPRPGSKKKLVVVEAKHARDRRSSADVVGQLLKYYAHALDLGSDGLAAYVACAKGTRPSRLVSFKRVLHCASLKEAQVKAAGGASLRPRDIQLLVALDEDARKFEPRLVKTAALLHERHRIPIGVVIVHNHSVRWLCPVSNGRQR